MLNLTLATRNGHKAREFAEILGAPFFISDLTGAAEMPSVEETGQTFEENAVLKALAASRLLKGLVVADDSGLEVEALHGAPGVRSARYAGETATDADNVAKLLMELSDASPGGQHRRARFCCAIALAEGDRILKVFDGAINGIIAREPRGSGGFGYDPIFIPAGYSETFAQLGDSVKNGMSHRARAIAQLREYLKP